MGMVMWKYRQHMRLARIGFVVLYIFLDMTMSRPAYYLISRINVTGSSTGWHRSLLIDRAIQNFSEWWLVGTDVTRHWMPTGVSFSTEHTDITNYYLQFGVWAGILAVILLISILWTAFRGIGQILSIYKDEAEHTRFLVWCLGAALFAHACTSISVAYYDQSFLFFWFNVAVISSLLSAARQEQTKLVPVKSTKLSWKPRLAAPQTT
jgi:hypothetical protein